MNADPGPLPRAVADATLEKIKAQLRAGQKIAAIKTLRDATGLPLIDAKAAVEKLHAELHAQDPQQYPLDDGKGCGVALALFVAVGIAVVTVWLWSARG